MKFPRYWALGEAEVTLRRGKRSPVAVWEWSDTSVAEARARARARVDELAERVTRNGAWPNYRYGYDEGPLREPIIHEYTNNQGEQTAVISRNSYGCLVLNTAAAMFIDVDLPLPPDAGCLGQLFAKRRLEQEAAAWRAEHEKAELAHLGEWLMQNADWGFRIYRTHGGLRYLVTHATFTPDSDAARLAMAQLNADPLYAKLCIAQLSFRARLTPKPWRLPFKFRGIKLGEPPARWPFRTPEEQAAYDEWLRTYETACAARATCNLVGTLGPEAVHPHIAPIITLHDKMTRVGEELQLA